MLISHRSHAQQPVMNPYGILPHKHTAAGRPDAATAEMLSPPFDPLETEVSVCACTASSVPILRSQQHDD